MRVRQSFFETFGAAVCRGALVGAAFAGAALLLFAACSSDGGGPSGGDGPTDAELDAAMEITEKQADYYDQAAAWAAAVDTASAIDSLVAALEADPDVAWAESTGTGVNIQWKSGIVGFITLRLLPGEAADRTRDSKEVGKRVGAPAGSSALAPAGPLSHAPASSPSTGYHSPKHNKSLFLAPCYSEFKQWDNYSIDSGAVALPRAGYQPFTVYKDEEVTLARIREVDSGGYGVVRISSHGAPWPSVKDIQEVYFITGEEPTRESIAANWEEIESWVIGIGKYAGGKRYFVSSLYFATHNDFDENLPLVSLGFCFGYWGKWPGDIMTHCKAGAVTGWDWAVTSAKDGAYFESLLHNLCDTTRANPMTIRAWHTTGDTSYTETDGRVISFHMMSVADSFGLWTPLRIDSLDPNVALAGDTITVVGSGFGAAPGTVRFDETAGTIVSWANGVVRVIVPSGPDPGEMEVRVVAGGRTSAPRPFTLIDDELVQRLLARSWIDVSLYAPHSYDGDQAGNNVFDHILQPIGWNGLAFTGETKSHDAARGTVLSFSGSVSRDGRVLNLVYTYADTVFTGLPQQRYEHMRVTGLPYDPTIAGENYTATGTAIEPYVSEMSWYERRWNAGGAIEYQSVYRETYWDDPGYVALTCSFGGLQRKR